MHRRPSLPLIFHDGANPSPQPPAPPAQPPTPPAPAPENPPPNTNGQTVPLDRFNEVTRQAREAQRAAEAATARLQEIEDAQKSEAEREKAQREREKARADAAEARLTTVLRDTAVRNAAMTPAGDRGAAIDADAIVAMIATGNYGDVDPEKPETAAAAVAKLAEAKPTLFVSGGTPTPFGTPAGGVAARVPGIGTPAPSNGNGQNDDPKLAAGTAILAGLRNRR